MILLSNPWQSHSEFKALNDRILSFLAKDLTKRPDYYPARKGIKFEEDVLYAANQAAKNTPFEGEIVQISGQKFPDIVAKVESLGGYGIEVKTTEKNHWKTTGSSIFEGTRVDGIDRISMMFAKLADPVEFRWRPYEDCLCDVAVTHSPRYLIDMNARQTIFDRIDLPYDELRKLENPFKPIKEYFRNQVLQPGQDVWWADPQEGTSSLIIKHFSDLPTDQQEVIKAQSMVFFPDIFGTSPTKYKSVASWMVARHSTVTHSMRDNFSAGGQKSIQVNNKTYPQVPKIYFKLQSSVSSCVEFLRVAQPEDLEHYWGSKLRDNRLQQWIELIEHHSTKHGDLPIEEMILEQLSLQ